MEGATEIIPTRHVAVATFPLASHPMAMLGLVRGMAASAPEGTIFSFFNSEGSNAKLFGEASGGGRIRPYDVDYGSTVGPGNPVVIPEAVVLYQRLAPERLRGAVSRAEEEVGCKVSCLLTDAFVWFAGEMAEEMGVPWVAYWTISASWLRVLVQIDSIRATLGTTGLENKMLDFIQGLSFIRGVDIPKTVMTNALEMPFTFANMLYKAAKELHRAAVVPVNSFQDFEFSTTDLVFIGPHVLLSPRPFIDQYACIPWLDRQKPASVVYIGFGTEAKLAPDEIRELTEALEETGHPYLWSYRGEGILDLEGFMERTKSNGKIVSWSPQSEVLKHPSVGAFMTHCGWNSLLESAAGGVPLIGRPFFGDQPFNAAVMERMLRIGMGVEGGVFTKSGLMKTLRTVLESEEGEAMRERARALKLAAGKAVDEDGVSARNYRELVQIVCG